jgi:hypothetical protein
MSIPKDMLCSATDDTNGFCILPSRVIDSPFIDQLKNDGYSHIILVFGETKFYKGKMDVYGGDPQLLSTHTYNDYNFNVYASVYDLQTGEEITEISLSDDTRSYFGTMTFLPWTIMVNGSSFFNAMGRRIGEELARCIQYDNSSEVYRNTVAQ